MTHLQFELPFSTLDELVSLSKHSCGGAPMVRTNFSIGIVIVFIRNLASHFHLKASSLDDSLPRVDGGALYIQYNDGDLSVIAWRR